MISKGRTRWRDDQGVGPVCESGLSQPTHTDDVLIGEYGPHEPTHTETRLADESLSTSATEITETGFAGDRQKRGTEVKKSDQPSWSEARSQEECGGCCSRTVLRALLGDAGDDDLGRAGQSSSSPHPLPAGPCSAGMFGSESHFDPFDLASFSFVGAPYLCQNLAPTKLCAINNQQ